MDLMPGEESDDGAERLDELPIPLLVIVTDHGNHRIVAVSRGLASLCSTTPRQVLADFAGDPFHSIVESERESALAVLEYALMYPGGICTDTFHVTGDFAWPNGGDLVRCNVQSVRLGEGLWRSYVFLSPVSVGTTVPGGSEEERPRDLTERMLEEQVIARLSTLGYEIVGMIHVEEREVRYFRMKKMHLGLQFEDVEDYRESIEGDLDRVIAPEERAAVKEALALDHVLEELDHSELYSYPFSMTTRDGRHLRKLLQFTYMDDDKKTIFICRTDITSQYLGELAQMDRLREAKAAAEKANEAKSTFLSSVSHDLRTPLNGIIGFTDLAIKTTDPVRKQDYLAKVKSSSSLLLDLVNDTLDLSRIESGKSTLEPHEVSLRDSIQTVLTSLGPSAEIKGIDLTASFWDGPDRAVWMDQLKFQKVLLNLLSNAIKYTPSGGAVHVTAELSCAGERIGDTCTCRVSVADNGIGIDAAFLPRIFDAFSQEHQPGTGGVMGTGLGLAIVKRIVNLMGGTVEVTSTVGEGSTFCVSLPLELVDAARISAKDETNDAGVLAGMRMLVCEDNYLNVEILRAMLEEEGVETTCARDGRAGLEAFSASVPGDFSAILMDVRMPVMDGIEATRRIRALDRPDAASVPIVALTGDVLDEDVRNCREAGMCAVVGKPVDRARLVSVLSGLVHAR